MKTNEILLLTEGMYSDYHIIGLYKVLKDFDIDMIKKNGNMYGSRGIYYSHRKLAEAEANGFIQEIKYYEKNFSYDFDGDMEGK